MATINICINPACTPDNPEQPAFAAVLTGAADPVQAAAEGFAPCTFADGGIRYAKYFSDPALLEHFGPASVRFSLEDAMDAREYHNDAWANDDTDSVSFNYAVWDSSSNGHDCYYRIYLFKFFEDKTQKDFRFLIKTILSAEMEPEERNRVLNHIVKVLRLMTNERAYVAAAYAYLQSPFEDPKKAAEAKKFALKNWTKYSKLLALAEKLLPDYTRVNLLYEVPEYVRALEASSAPAEVPACTPDNPEQPASVAVLTGAADPAEVLESDPIGMDDCPPDPLESVPEHLRPVVAALQDLPGLQLDIRGTWLWVSGDTYPVKDAIKASGCRWASRKRMWFYKPAFAAVQ